MKTIIASVTAIIIAMSFSLAGQEVSTSYDHNYDFSKVKSFTVRIMPPWDNSKIETYTESVVAKELNAKGWTQAPNESSADVLVVIKGTVKDKKFEETYYDGGMQVPAGVSSPAGVIECRVIVEKIGEGTINIFDAKTNQLVFSGTGAAEVSRNEKKNEQRIKKGLEKVFKDFPPSPGV